eukprot:Lankesteria_metandrocarpae@DN4919_c0_g1_i1.p1
MSRSIDNDRLYNNHHHLIDGVHNMVCTKITSQSINTISCTLHFVVQPQTKPPNSSTSPILHCSAGQQQCRHRERLKQQTNSLISTAEEFASDENAWYRSASG